MRVDWFGAITWLVCVPIVVAMECTVVAYIVGWL